MSKRLSFWEQIRMGNMQWAITANLGKEQIV
jgi:hypothetical protein